MTKVNKLVRTLMLTYPSLYPTRSATIRSIFLSTNYRWNRKGELVPDHPIDKRFEGPIDLTDLDQSDDNFSGDFDFYKLIRANNELERMTRLHRAEHIDMYCQWDVGIDRYGYTALDDWYLDSDSSCLFSAPFGKIDIEWASEMEKFISEMMVAYNRVFNLHYDMRDPGDSLPPPEPSMLSQMPEKFQKRHARLVEVSGKLDAQTGHRAKRAEFVKNLVAEIKAEEEA